jgi:hypothetical protein
MGEGGRTGKRPRLAHRSADGPRKGSAKARTLPLGNPTTIWATSWREEGQRTLEVIAQAEFGTWQRQVGLDVGMELWW